MRVAHGRRLCGAKIEEGLSLGLRPPVAAQLWAVCVAPRRRGGRGKEGGYASRTRLIMSIAVSCDRAFRL